MRHDSPKMHTIDVQSSFNASSMNISLNGKKERRSKKNRSTSKNGCKAVKITQKSKAKEPTLNDLGDTFKSFDNSKQDLRCPATIEHTKRNFEEVQKTEESPDCPRKPIILS